jgi:hypothetical protein
MASTQSGKPAFQPAGKPAFQPAGKRFLFYAPTRSLEDFKALAKEAAKLKRYGRVLMNVSAMADKPFHEIPEGGSGWHEYAVCIPALHRVFPHPKIAPHVPADFVKRNQEFLTLRVAVLRELGLEASWHGNEPHYLPEGFFAEFPHLRGPRVDHPRRSRQEEFSICVDLPEAQEIVEWMMAELKRNVPMLGAFSFNTNDAGGGLCWGAALYSGPNGPKHCKAVTAGDRVRTFCETLHRGAGKGGGDVTVFIGHANFWQNEQAEVEKSLPPNTWFAYKAKRVLGVSTNAGGEFPVKGLVNPLGVIAAMERYAAPEVEDVMVSVGAMYYRDCDNAETAGKLVELVTDCIEEPVKGLRGRFEKLRKFSARWAGDDQADAVFEALFGMDQAFTIKNALVPRYFIPMYTAASLRHTTRPLVIKPELLTPEEESYFLPHVFNIRASEARTDYADLHGGRIRLDAGGAEGGGIPAFLSTLEKARDAAAALEGARQGPQGKWLYRLATSLRIWVSMMRSAYNFYFASLVRDRQKAELAQERAVPPKEGSWAGEGEILRWNELMRDELDNANELIALLTERGLGQIGHVDDPRYEDCFVFGPDIVGDLKKKVKIMREHWLDVEKYLYPPHK